MSIIVGEGAYLYEQLDSWGTLPPGMPMGEVGAVGVDEKDNVWVIHRGAGGLHDNERGAELNPPLAECCKTAPPVLVFDQAGNLLRAWGGPGQGYEWPQLEHGILVDGQDHVWLGAGGDKDSHILKFTRSEEHTSELQSH